MSQATTFATADNVDAILAQLIAGLRPILSDRLVGIYLYGSLATGDFDPYISDIDLAVVLKETLDSARFEQLHQLQQSVIKRQPQWHDRLELAYISRSGLQTFRQQTSAIGIISPGEPFHMLEAGADWLISWYPLRHNGIALVGPPIKSLIADIPTPEFLQAVGEHICRYRDSVKKPQTKPGLAYIVLTVARGLCTLEQGKPRSKVKSAAWAMKQYPQWAALIKSALAWRADPESDRLTIEQIRPEVAAYVSDMLSRRRTALPR